MPKAMSVEGKKDVWRKMKQPVYAWWVTASSNMLSLASRGSVSGVCVSWS